MRKRRANVVGELYRFNRTWLERAALFQPGGFHAQLRSCRMELICEERCRCAIGYGDSPLGSRQCGQSQQCRRRGMSRAAHVQAVPVFLGLVLGQQLHGELARRLSRLIARLTPMLGVVGEQGKRVRSLLKNVS